MQILSPVSWDASVGSGGRSVQSQLDPPSCQDSIPSLNPAAVGRKTTCRRRKSAERKTTWWNILKKVFPLADSINQSWIGSLLVYRSLATPQHYHYLHLYINLIHRYFHLYSHHHFHLELTWSPSWIYKFSPILRVSGILCICMWVLCVLV